jgi:ankyrin repeat protein
MRFLSNGMSHSGMRLRVPVLLVLAAVLCWSSAALCDPIHGAAQKGDLAKIKALVAQDPSLISAKDKAGKTALHIAAEYNHKDVAEFLIASGADVNARDDEGGFTPLDLALSCYHYMDVLELLIAKGANVNTTSNQGVTPLHETAMRGQKDAAALLLAKGADVNAADSKGNTALLWALLMGHIDLARTLIDANADVNASNFQGVTPMFLAQKRSDTKLEDLLRQHGAH